jgi:hypothetical protein
MKKVLREGTGTKGVLNRRRQVIIDDVQACVDHMGTMSSVGISNMVRF